MALQGSDYFLINRAGVHYKLLASDILAYISGNIGSTEFDVANIAARNALTGMTTGDRVFVADATGDATVSAGWAIYAWRGSAFTKIAEQEGLDVTVAGTNLTYTAAPTNGTVVSNTGNDATLPLADATNAGLLAPAQFTKLGFLTVAGNTDLDAIRAASHAAATTQGTATTNPVTLTGQAIGFSISNLASAP
jgi:hypothetical protein